MKYLLSLAVLAFLAAGCNRHTQSDSAIDAKVDSIVGTRMEEINRRAMDDLDQRMTIEVKAKADSIIEARRRAIDSPRKPQPPLP